MLGRARALPTTIRSRPLACLHGGQVSESPSPGLPPAQVNILVSVALRCAAQISHPMGQPECADSIGAEPPLVWDVVKVIAERKEDASNENWHRVGIIGLLMESGAPTL